MRLIKIVLFTCLFGAAMQANASLVSVTTYFSQDSFSNGGSVTGYFRGTDLNGDGRLLSSSPFISAFTGVALSNELEYAEITFSGTGTSLGSQTLIYDKSVADVFAPQNFFFGFSFNIGSGTIGDEDNEGFSFSPFAPSTNYLLGAVFRSLFIDSINNVDASQFGSCDGIRFCGAILELVPDANSPSGIATFSQSLSVAIVSVSEPSVMGLMLMLFGFFALRKCREFAGITDQPI